MTSAGPRFSERITSTACTPALPVPQPLCVCVRMLTHSKEILTHSKEILTHSKEILTHSKQILTRSKQILTRFKQFCDVQKLWALVHEEKWQHVCAWPRQRVAAAFYTVTTEFEYKHRSQQGMAYAATLKSTS